MTQPSFVPVSEATSVRACMVTPTPEIGRQKKAGLLGSPSSHTGTGRGTPGPDAGFALTLAARALHDTELSPSESPHDVEMGVALLCAKRAAIVGRGPAATDVEVVLDIFGYRTTLGESELVDRQARFAGLAHSYFAQRSFVDSVSDAILRQSPGSVVDFWHFSL